MRTYSVRTSMVAITKYAIATNKERPNLTIVFGSKDDSYSKRNAFRVGKKFSRLCSKPRDKHTRSLTSRVEGVPFKFRELDREFVLISRGAVKKYDLTKENTSKKRIITSNLDMVRLSTMCRLNSFTKYVPNILSKKLTPDEILVVEIL